MHFIIFVQHIRNHLLNLYNLTLLKALQNFIKVILDPVTNRYCIRLKKIKRDLRLSILIAKIWGMI